MFAGQPPVHVQKPGHQVQHSHGAGLWHCNKGIEILFLKNRQRAPRTTPWGRCWSTGRRTGTSPTGCCRRGTPKGRPCWPSSRWTGSTWPSPCRSCWRRSTAATAGTFSRPSSVSRGSWSRPCPLGRSSWSWTTSRTQTRCPSEWRFGRLYSAGHS